MTSTINPRQLTITEQSSLGQFTFKNTHQTAEGTDNGVTDDASLSPTTSSLPGRVTEVAAAHAQNRALRIDTEQLRRLSICDTDAKGHRTRSSAANLRHHQFQKFREHLWTQGRGCLGDRNTPHYNIAPVKLPTTPDATNDNITIYTVVHSQGHSPIGLRRRFDRGLLTATVPEPFQSPSTPNFDRDELLSAIADTNKTLASRRFRQSTRRASLPARAARSRRGSTAPIPEGIPMRKLIPRSFFSPFAQ